MTLIQIGKQGYLFWFLLVLFDFSFLLIRSHQKYFFPAVGRNNSRGKKKRTNLSFHCNWKFPCKCYFHNEWNIKDMYNKRQSMTACAYCCSSKKAMWCKMQRVNKTAHVEANLVTKGGLVYNRVCTPVNWKTVQ